MCAKLSCCRRHRRRDGVGWRRHRKGEGISLGSMLLDGEMSSSGILHHSCRGLERDGGTLLKETNRRPYGIINEPNLVLPLVR